MVSPKVLYKIEHWRETSKIWVDDPALIEVIKTQDGLSHVTDLSSLGIVYVEFHARYDRDEVMAELEQRLAAVYGVWKDALDD